MMIPLHATLFPPILAEFDWGQVFYILIPLVYVAAQFFGGEKEEKGGGAKGKKGGSGGEEISAEERMRRVREEIRRRVAERTGETETPEPRPLAPASSRSDRSYDPSRPDGMGQRGELRRSSVPPPVPPAAPAPAEPRDGVDGLEKQLAQQRKRLAEMRQENAAARERARAIVREGEGRTARFRRPAKVAVVAVAGSASTRDQVQGLLRDKASLKTAFVLTEVLGRPVSMRSGSMDSLP